MRRARARCVRRGPRRSPSRSPARGRRRPRRGRRRRGRRPRRRARASAAAIPSPSSSTSTSTALALRPRARTVTLPSAGVWRIAFWIRLKRTRCSFSGVGVRRAAPRPAARRRPCTPRSSACARIAATVSSISSPSSTWRIDQEISPASIRESSKRSSIRSLRTSTWVRISPQVALARLARRDAVVDRLDQQPQRGQRRAQVVRGGGDQLAARLPRPRGWPAPPSPGARRGRRRGRCRRRPAATRSDLLGAHPVRDRNRGGAGEEGGDGDRDRAPHLPLPPLMAGTCSRRPRPSR